MQPGKCFIEKEKSPKHSKRHKEPQVENEENKEEKPKHKKKNKDTPKNEGQGNNEEEKEVKKTHKNSKNKEKKPDKVEEDQEEKPKQKVKKKENHQIHVEEDSEEEDKKPNNPLASTVDKTQKLEESKNDILFISDGDVEEEKTELSLGKIIKFLLDDNFGNNSVQRKIMNNVGLGPGDIRLYLIVQKQLSKLIQKEIMKLGDNIKDKWEKYALAFNKVKKLTLKAFPNYYTSEKVKQIKDIYNNRV